MNSVKLRTLLTVMLKLESLKLDLDKHFDEIKEELNSLTFVEPNKLLKYDLIYRQLILATVKNYIYEQNDENRKGVNNIIDLLHSIKVVGE